MGTGRHVHTEAIASSCLAGGTALAGASANAISANNESVWHNLKVLNIGATACLVSPDSGTTWLPCVKAGVTNYDDLHIHSESIIVHRTGTTSTGNFAGVFVAAF